MFIFSHRHQASRKEPKTSYIHRVQSYRQIFIAMDPALGKPDFKVAWVAPIDLLIVIKRAEETSGTIFTSYAVAN